MRVLDRDGVVGPVDQLEVVLAVAERNRLVRREAEPVGDELQAGSLRDVRVRELEEERKRLGDEEPAVELRPQVGAELVEPLRVADDDELRRRPLEPLEQRPDDVQLDVLEARVPLRLRRRRARRTARRRRSS